jgi:hypothetical protein
MKLRSALGAFVFGASIAAKMLFMLSMFTLAGCDAGKYNVILAIDAKEYRSAMSWEEIREAGFKKKHHTMRIFDADGKAIPLFRFMHESLGVMPLDEAEIHISTPIIIEKKYETIVLSVLDHGNVVSSVRVVINDLKSVKSGPTAYAVPLNIP